MVSIELPEATVEHIEMLIRKVFSHLVNVFFGCHIEKHVFQVGSSEISICYLPIVIHVYFVEDAHHHGVRVPVLELRRCLQEFKSRVRLQ